MSCPISSGAEDQGRKRILAYVISGMKRWLAGASRADQDADTFRRESRNPSPAHHPDKAAIGAR